MVESWHLQKEPEPMTWTRQLVESCSVAAADGSRLLEVTLHSAMGRAWNPSTSVRSIQGPGVVQYRLDVRRRWSVQLHKVGQCLGVVAARNEKTLCPVKDLAEGFTRCPEHHVAGASGVPR